jgi:solute carrier family 35 protein E3
MQIADIVMPVQFLVCFVSAVLIDGIPWTETHRVLWKFEMSMELIVNIAVTCFFAIAVNIVTYALIGKTSAVTFQVVGHLKTVLTLLGGYFLFDRSNSNSNQANDHASHAYSHFFGILIAMFGMILYGDIKNSVQKASMLVRAFPMIPWKNEI